MGFPGTTGLEAKVQTPGTFEVWRVARLLLPLPDLWMERVGTASCVAVGVWVLDQACFPPRALVPTPVRRARKVSLGQRAGCPWTLRTCLLS